MTLKKSVVSTNPAARGTVRALGLDRIGHTVDLPDNQAVRGQIRAVAYLLDVSEAPAGAASAGSRKRVSSKKESES